MSTKDTTSDSKKAAGARGHYKYLNKSPSTDDNEDVIGFPDTRCGCGPCKPTWLQLCAGPKLFACNAGLILGIYIGMTSYLHGTLTTIERQFELSSSEAGGITIAADVAILCLVIFVTYLGHSGHRPRWIACGGIIIAVGLVICSVPHFIVDPLDPSSILVGGTYRSSGSSGVSQSGVCKLSSDINNTPAFYLESLANETSNPSQVETHSGDPFPRYSNASNVQDNCEGADQSSGLGLVKWLLIGQICVGCGAAPMFPLVISYIDDSVRKHEVTTYTAFMIICATIGPVFGLLLSSKATSLYVDFDRVDSSLIPDIPQHDPRWIGAWWLGFLVGGFVLFFVSLPMFFFPKRLARPKEVAEKGDQIEVGNNNDGPTSIYQPSADTSTTGTTGVVTGALATAKRLLCNVTLGILIIAGACDMAAGIIGRVFGIKYMQTQFGLSPMDAALYTGGIFIPCLTVAQVVSAFICRRFKLDTKQCVMFVLIALGCGTVTVPLKMWIGCPNPQIAGVNVLYGEMKNEASTMPSLEIRQIESSLQSTCNTDCGCPDEIFRPVCGSDGVTYISPCHAGCLEMNSTNEDANKLIGGTKIYHNCKCILSNTDTTVPGGTAVSGLCHHYCDSSRLTIYIFLGAISIFFQTLIINPIIFINLRIVDPKDRSVAIGLKSLINKCLAFFPPPVYMGAIINSQCIYWQRTCGKRGSCWMYNIVNYRFAFFGTITILQILGIICYSSLYCFLTRKSTSTIQKLKEESICEPDEVTKIELTDVAKATE